MNKKLTTLLFILAGTILPTTSVFAEELRNPQPTNYQGQQSNYQGQPANYQGQVCTKYKYFTIGKVQPNGGILGTYHWVYKIPVKGGYEILPDREDEGGTETLPDNFGHSLNPGDTFHIDNGYTPSSNQQSGVPTTNPQNLH